MTNEAGEGAALSSEREAEIRARFAELDEPDDLQRLASEFAEGKTSRAMAYFALAWEDYRDLLAEIDRLRGELAALRTALSDIGAICESSPMPIATLRQINDVAHRLRVRLEARQAIAEGDGA